MVRRERHAGKSTAARITSTGAGTPVQSSNDAAPCATSTSRPPTTRRAGCPRGVRGRAVRVRQLDERLSPRELDEHLVPLAASRGRRGRRRSPSGGQSPRREKTRACGSASRNAAAEPPSPTITGRSAGSPSRIAASVVSPCTSPVPDHERVHGRQPARRRARRRPSLCGAVTFAPANPSATSPRTRLLEPLRRHVERDVRAVERERRERGVLHPRRERVLDRMPEQGDEPRPARDHGATLCCSNTSVTSSRTRTRRPSRGTPTRSR